jgi:bacterioferritin-associated ferredoxin
MAEQEENDLIICRCEEVSREEVLQAIAEGAQTLVEIKWRTRAGMGLCQSKTCRRLVSKILAEETGQAMADINPATHRPPVRPVELGVLAAEDGLPEASVPGSGTPPCVVGTGRQGK